MSHFPRSELKAWLVIGLSILALLVAVGLARGVSGIAAVEVFLFGGAFALGVTVWAGWRLWQGRDDPR